MKWAPALGRRWLVGVLVDYYWEDLVIIGIP
jgi:hypothetical protein